MTSSRRARLLIAVWSVPACLTVAESRTLAHLQGTPLPSLRLMGPTFVEWYVWALITPLILGLTARFPVNRASAARRSIPVHLLAMLVATALSGIVYAVAALIFATRRPGSF